MENELIKIISIKNIVRNEKQPRKSFDKNKLDDLAASIKEQGILQPLLVEKIDEDKYRIIAGERRYRAAEIAGVNEVPVIVKKFNNLQKMQVAIIENVQREELNPIEEAYAYMYLMHEGGFTQEEVAKKIGKSRSAVANTIRLASLQQNYVNSLIKGEITQGHARALLSIQNPYDRELLYKEIISNGLNVRDSENLAVFLNNGGRITKNFDIQKLRDSVIQDNNGTNDINIYENDDEESEEADVIKKSKKNDTKKSKYSIDELSIIKEIEDKFSKILNMKVRLKGNTKYGKMQISYISYRELDKLYKRLGSDKDLIEEEEE